ncbi:MAG: cation transporter [Candidatus Bathyarchaeota archaeon]|nr:cation transporter [Candidatus Bathyarchaeota archaeon]
MARTKRSRVSGDLAEYVVLILHKEGAQTLQQIEEKTALQTVTFHSRAQRRHDDYAKVQYACEGLVCSKLIKLNSDAKYELTDDGRAKAAETVWQMERGAAVIENQFLSPSATARNCTVGYVFLAALKMLVGLFTGSVGLVADGADTTVDTAASAIVWAGIRFKRELWGTITILGLMFFTAALLFYDSAGSILENLKGTFVPMTLPLVVVIVELLALGLMMVISIYQRFVGRRSQSLALISQSIDSKNSMYSSAAVIVGAVATIFGVYWVDAVVGGFIAVRITLDGIDLTREVIKSMRGEKPELSKYKIPFEKQIATRRSANFRNWILYAIQDEKAHTKTQLVDSLEKTFRPSYMPDVFNEFTVGRGMDFNEEFDALIKPLLDEGYLTQVDGKYALTSRGKTFLKDTIDTIRYRETEL